MRTFGRPYLTLACPLAHEKAAASLAEVAARVVFRHGGGTEEAHEDGGATHFDNLFWETAQMKR